MAAECPIEGLPPELLTDIMSRLSLAQQLGVRRVSRQWRAAVDACLSRRHKLHLCRKSSGGSGRCSGVSPKRGIKLLESMPALRRLFVEDSREKSDPDQLLLDVASVEQLCSMCPLLQEVSLGCTLDETCVKTLLRNLPDLRALSLPKFRSDGEFLSLLPAGMLSLCLSVDNCIDPASAHHLKRCPQLRELNLDDICAQLNRSNIYCFRSPFFDELSKVLATFTQLERVTLGFTPPELTSALAGCTLLMELDISSDTVSEFDMFGLLTACGRLERLRVSCIRVKLSPPASGAVCLRDQFGLTHLEVSDAEVDDAAFNRMTHLLHDLRHLKVGGCFGEPGLTEDGLASGLRQLTNLEVLVLEMDGAFPLRLGSPILSTLGDLPLKSLAVDIDMATGDAPFGVAAVFERCTLLTALRLRLYMLRRDRFSSLVDELASSPLMQREVTLSMPFFIADEMERLPRNIRVLENVYYAWQLLIGWPGWMNYCDDSC